MNNIKKEIYASLVCFSIFLLMPFTSQSQSLKIGDVAPTLKTGAWIKGTPVHKFEKGKIYVLEFWATWCGPCKETIPHISFLSKKYGNNVEFIGISVWENNTNKVEPFVKQIGNSMDYAVTIDHQSDETSRRGYMTETYLKPLGIKSIPATIVIGKTGLIEWTGNPMDLEAVLQHLIIDNWNKNVFIRDVNSKVPLESIRKSISKSPNWDITKREVQASFPYLSADSVILSWQLDFFYTSRDYTNYTKAIIEYIDKYNQKVNPNFLNFYAWEVFKYSSDKGQLLLAAKWLESEVVQNFPYAMDTYANILYKLGDKMKAISTQKMVFDNIQTEFLAKAVALNYYKILTNQPTWPVADKQKYYSNNPEAWFETSKLLSQHSKLKGDSIIFIVKTEYMRNAGKWSDMVSVIVDFTEKSNHLSGVQLNENAWDIFYYSSDVRELKRALEWSRKSLLDKSLQSYWYAYYDTYANLLHKLGKKRKSFLAMQKAVELCPAEERDSYIRTLAKIEKGEKTW